MFGFSSAVIVGISLGFGFGVGCALAVMYGIWMGGYRAAIRDAQKNPLPSRYQEAMSRTQKFVDRVT